MTCHFTRRELLRTGAVAAGVVAGGSVRSWAVPVAATAARSAPSLPVAIQRLRLIRSEGAHAGTEACPGPDWRYRAAGTRQDGDDQAES